MKRCCGCELTKEETEFHKDRTTKDGLDGRCRTCRLAYRRATPNIRNRAVWKFRGIKNPDGSQFSTGDYNRKFKAQNHRCAVCGYSSEFHRLNVDHNHQTMIVRGLLCDYCNQNVIGKYDKSGYCRQQPEAEVYLMRTQGFLPVFPEPTTTALYHRTYYEDEVNDHCRRELTWKRKGIDFNGQPLTWPVFDAKMAETNYRCAICKEGSAETLVADHDKLTGEFRGALCSECNRRAVAMVEKYGFYRSEEITSCVNQYLTASRTGGV